MTDIAWLLLFNAFAIAGVHLSCQEGMIFEVMQRVKGWISKPLYDCPTCMASIHSTYFFIPFALLTDSTLIYIYPLYILTLAGVSTLVWRVIDKLESKMQ